MVFLRCVLLEYGTVNFVWRCNVFHKSDIWMATHLCESEREGEDYFCFGISFRKHCNPWSPSCNWNGSEIGNCQTKKFWKFIFIKSGKKQGRFTITSLRFILLRILLLRNWLIVKDLIEKNNVLQWWITKKNVLFATSVFKQFRFCHGFRQMCIRVTTPSRQMQLKPSVLM